MKQSKGTPKVWIIIISAYLLIPFIVTVIYSLVTDWSTSIIPSGFTLRNYQAILSDSVFWMCLLRTILICIVPVAIAIVVLLLAMYIVIVYCPKLEKYIQIICMIPYAIQGVILSVSIISLFTGTGTFLSNRVIMLIGAYCILILPYIYQGIRNNLYGINAAMLLEAAEMLGASKLYAFFRIIVPNIISGITVSALLSVSIIFGDFVLANNIAGNNFQNVQVYLFQVMKTSSGKSSAVVVIIFLVVALITGVVISLQTKDKKNIQ